MLHFVVSAYVLIRNVVQGRDSQLGLAYARLGNAEADCGVSLGPKGGRGLYAARGLR